MSDRPDPRDVVAGKRDGRRLSGDEITGFVLAHARGDVADEVAAAFLMAAYLRGLDREETAAYTRALIRSGRTLSLQGIERFTVDKHSTGGVADGVTLVLAPLLASLGLAVAKLSGRGLGHTGGTLDKLEAIRGLRTDLSPEEMERQVREIGCAVASQTEDLVPADGALYALRDATATVDSIPLIAASVMSKKLAVETDLILLDVKAGSGAFMKSPEAAWELATACMSLARTWGRPARAAVTDMSQPLGTAIGNALEVEEAVRVLRGERPGRLADLVVEVAAAALEEAGSENIHEARERARVALTSGAGVESFRRMVEAQGGDPRVAEDPAGLLPRARVRRPIQSPAAGWLQAVDAEALGRAAARLGAGRARKGEAIDPAVGIVFTPKVGDGLEAGALLGEVYAADDAAAEEAVRSVVAAISVSDTEVAPPPLVYGWHRS